MPKMTKHEIELGYDLQKDLMPIVVDLDVCGHMAVCGSSGSGKTLSTLYYLYKLSTLTAPVDLYIGDFKRSYDYKGITVDTRFAEFDKVIDLIDQFYMEFESTPENNSTLKILLLDEYAGLIVWLTQHDKKKCEEIKGKISNLLMLGRSRHCFVWIIVQRMTAQLFPAGIGAIDNFQILVGLGRLSMESHRSLFGAEHLKEPFEPRQGQGLCLIDGQPLRTIQTPFISDKKKLKRLLRGKFKRKR